MTGYIERTTPRERRRNASVSAVIGALGLSGALLYIGLADGENPFEDSKCEKGKMITAEFGDTLWDISEEHFPNQDPRKTLTQIDEVNDRTGQLMEGEIITLPENC